MITFLRGNLVESLPDRAVVDVQGVGYECYIPTSTYDALPPAGEPVQLLTHFHVREQEQALYGFATTDERDLFRLLIDRVSGIGPKMGLAVLSGMRVADFKNNVVNGDVAILSKIKGVGKKTAERMVVELKDKVPAAELDRKVAAVSMRSSRPGSEDELVDALLALGYRRVEAEEAASSARNEAERVEDQLKLALRSLRR